MSARWIEAFSVVGLLVTAIITNNPLWAIAAGAFAIASNV